MTGTAELGTGQAIRLIAGREIRARLTSRTYLITTAVFVLIVVVGAVVVNAINSSESSKTVGVLPAAQSASATIEAVASSLGADVNVEPVPNLADGTELVKSGDLDALVVTSSPALKVVVKDSLGGSLPQVLNPVAQQLALSQEVLSLGGNPAEVSQRIAEARVAVDSLEPPPVVDGGQITVGVIAGILIFISLMTCGQLVAQGVVEEKTSRVVELLLATVRPWQLLAGKVLGIGTVGLIQVAAVVGAGVATALRLGTLDASSVELGPTALWAVIWFIIGFTSFALVLAAMASLVSRQEDVGSVVGPVTAVMIVPYLIGISVAPSDPTSPLVEWLSYVPFCAPLIMPIRIALGTVEGWQIAVSVILSLATIPLLVWFAGRVYSNAVLRSGGKVRLRDALRSSQS